MPLCRGIEYDVRRSVVHCNALCCMSSSVLTLRLAASALCLHCFSLSSRSALSFSAGKQTAIRLQDSLSRVCEVYIEVDLQACNPAQPSKINTISWHAQLQRHDMACKSRKELSKSSGIRCFASTDAPQSLLSCNATHPNRCVGQAHEPRCCRCCSQHTLNMQGRARACRGSPRVLSSASSCVCSLSSMPLTPTAVSGALPASPLPLLLPAGCMSAGSRAERGTRRVILISWKSCRWSGLSACQRMKHIFRGRSAHF